MRLKKKPKKMIKSFDYNEMLNTFDDNYFNQGWNHILTLKKSYRILKALEEIPALDELTKFAKINTRGLKRKLRKILPKNMYKDLMKDLETRKAQTSSTDLDISIKNSGINHPPFDDLIVLPKNVMVIIEKDGSSQIIKRHSSAGYTDWPTGRGPHIVDKTKESSKDYPWDKFVANPETEWTYIPQDKKFDKRTTVGKVLSKKQDELLEAEARKSKTTSERFTKMTPADFDKLSKELKRKEKEIKQKQADQAASEDEFHEEE